MFDFISSLAFPGADQRNVDVRRSANVGYPIPPMVPPGIVGRYAGVNDLMALLNPGAGSDRPPAASGRTAFALAFTENRCSSSVAKSNLTVSGLPPRQSATRTRYLLCLHVSCPSGA